MEEAVKIAKQVTQKWKVCILSPGAPSYNLFKNFEERGKQFKQAVLELSK
jgi:UDP-N-acetylmuramoylalanine--D-glutamate ligase